MRIYEVTDETEYRGGTIHRDIFGTNFVAHYDFEFASHPELMPVLASLGIKNLRYPGGSITEHMFAAPDYSSSKWLDDYLSEENDQGTHQAQLNDFFSVAGEIGASVQLVLPTRIAFATTATEALAQGTYGERTEIVPEYLELLHDYVQFCMQIAQDKGVELRRLEIGNEFWGSGEMTASEYGLVAANALEYLSDSFPEIDMIAQVTPGAGLWSPLEDKEVYLEQVEDGYDIHFWPSEEEISENDLTIAIMPGQGAGRHQTREIASVIASNVESVSNLDGIVDHTYFRRGFDGIDGEKDYGLYKIPEIFNETAGTDEIDLFITEWSPRSIKGDKTSGQANAIGVQHASSIVEAFFELTASGVDGSNFWPLTFGIPTIDRRVLVDTDEAELTFSGAAFQMLSRKVEGLSPTIDYEIAGEIDVHGFENEQESIFIISERSGDDTQFILDFSSMNHSGEYLVSYDGFGESGETGIDIRADPVYFQIGAYATQEASIDLEMSPWSLSALRVQRITEFGDELEGTILEDHIFGRGGDDTISAGQGADTLNGNQGDDSLLGGEGNDIIRGGWGQDTLRGDDGDDTLLPNNGVNYAFGGNGDDVLRSTSKYDYLFGEAGNDHFEFGGNSVFASGGAESDYFEIASEGSLGTGMWAYNISSQLQYGTTELVSLENYVINTSIVNGGSGWDKIQLSSENEAFFLHNDYSGFDPTHLASDLIVSENSARRINSVEAFFAGGGDDLIDFTSDTHSLRGSEMRIHGESGNDVIWGSDANDQIFGGAGNDTLFGGAGENELSGGGGGDVFEFTMSSSGTSVQDFNPFEGDRLKFFVPEYYSLDEETIRFEEGSLNVSYLQVNGTDERNLSIPIIFDADDFVGGEIDIGSWMTW